MEAPSGKAAGGLAASAQLPHQQCLHSSPRWKLGASPRPSPPQAAHRVTWSSRQRRLGPEMLADPGLTLPGRRRLPCLCAWAEVRRPPGGSGQGNWPREQAGPAPVSAQGQQGDRQDTILLTSPGREARLPAGRAESQQGRGDRGRERSCDFCVRIHPALSRPRLSLHTASAQALPSPAPTRRDSHRHVLSRDRRPVLGNSGG